MAGKGGPIGHGGYWLQKTDPAKWPKQLQEFYTGRVAEIAALEHIDMTRHSGMVHQTVVIETVLESVYQFLLRKRGGVLVSTDDGDYDLHRITKQLPVWLNTLSRFHQLLGLCPLVDRRVILKHESMSDFALKKIAEAKVEEVGNENQGQAGTPDEGDEGTAEDGE